MPPALAAGFALMLALLGLLAATGGGAALALPVPLFPAIAGAEQAHARHGAGETR